MSLAVIRQAETDANPSDFLTPEKNTSLGLFFTCAGNTNTPHVPRYLLPRSHHGGPPPDSISATYMLYITLNRSLQSLYFTDFYHWWNSLKGRPWGVMRNMSVPHLVPALWARLCVAWPFSSSYLGPYYKNTVTWPTSSPYLGPL